jgi:hypothetical protein
MRRSKRHYDEWADRLVDDDALPHEEDAVSAFVGILRSAPLDESSVHSLPAVLAAETLSVVENASDDVMRSRDSRPLPMRWRRRAMISTFLSTLFGKIAVGTVAVAVAATGAAATGNLPDVAQQRVSDALSGIGIEIPAPEESPDGGDVELMGDVEESDGSMEATAPVLPEEASDKAKAVTDTVFEGDPTTGRDFGEAVSGTASDGAARGYAPELPELPEVPEVPELTEVPEVPELPEVPGLPDPADEGTSRRP